MLASCGLVLVLIIIIHKYGIMNQSIQTPLQNIDHLAGVLRRRMIHNEEYDDSNVVTSTTSKQTTLAQTTTAKRATTTSERITTTRQKPTTAKVTTTVKVTKPVEVTTPVKVKTTTAKLVSTSASKTTPKQTTNAQRMTFSPKIMHEIESLREMEIPQKEKDLMIDMLNILWRVKRENNFTMFLYGGTLLGSWRHHGFIPWDDDIDIVAPYNIYYQLFNALQALKPKYITKQAGWRQKFFSINSKHKTPFSWKWPYIDIQFYRENATHIWDAAGEFSGYKYKKSNVFPLVLRPYGNSWYESPVRTEEFLIAYYKDISWCTTGWYSHKHERGQRSHSVKCSIMKTFYPFVERKLVKGNWQEKLTFKGKVLSEKKVTAAKSLR